MTVQVNNAGAALLRQCRQYVFHCREDKARPESAWLSAIKTGSGNSILLSSPHVLSRHVRFFCTVRRAAAIQRTLKWWKICWKRLLTLSRFIEKKADRYLSGPRSPACNLVPGARKIDSATRRPDWKITCVPRALSAHVRRRVFRIYPIT